MVIFAASIGNGDRVPAVLHEGNPTWNARSCDWASLRPAARRFAFTTSSLVFWVVAADVVTLTDAPAFQDLSDRRAMILHVQPVAYVARLTVDRQGLVGDGVPDHEGK